MKSGNTRSDGTDQGTSEEIHKRPTKPARFRKTKSNPGKESTSCVKKSRLVAMENETDKHELKEQCSDLEKAQREKRGAQTRYKNRFFYCKSNKILTETQRSPPSLHYLIIGTRVWILAHSL
jgi:hypothetical protein